MIPVPTPSAVARFPLAWKREAGPRWAGEAARGSSATRIGYFMNLFPSLTETFVYREVGALRSLGCSILAFSIRRPPASELSEEARSLVDDTYYILPVAIPSFVRAHLRCFATRPRLYLRVLFEALTGTHGRHVDRIRSLLHFAEAVAILPLVRDLHLDHLHAHFAVGSATIAWILSRLLGVPFSLTAHAYDIWLDRLLLTEKLRDARFVVTCVAANGEHLVEAHGLQRGKWHIVYHGLDTDRFRPSATTRRASVPHVLTVGRLVEQKGFPDLLDALSLLRKRGHEFTCEFVGDGPLREDLESLARSLGLSDRVRFVGRVFQEDIVGYYQRADVFVLPSIPATNSDRDGIPNTLMEAMACGIPVVSTRFSGIPELVVDGQCGLLVDPRQPEQLADALGILLSDPGARAAMASSGRMRILEHFTLTKSAERLFALLGDRRAP